MARYILRVGRFEIEAAGAREVRELMEELKGGYSDFNAAPGKNGAGVTPASLPRDAKYREFLRRASADIQQKVLRALREGARSDGELRQMFDIKDNSKLSGTMSGLSKNAKGAGLEPTDVYVKETSQTTAGRVYMYRLATEMRDFLDANEELLGEESSSVKTDGALL